MNQTGRNFVLGLATLVALGGAGLLLLLFGEMEMLVGGLYEVRLQCPNAVGLRSGSSIELNGVPIGHIGEVTNTRDDQQYPVRIVALISEAVAIPAEVVPYATASLLGGSATLQLEGIGDATALPSDGTAVIRATIRSRLAEDLVEALDSRMDRLLGAMEEFRELASNLNDLLGPADPDQPGGVRNIRTAVEMLNRVLDDVHEALVMAQTWLGDEQLRTDARTAVTNANALIEQATVTMEEFAELASRIQTDSESVSKHLAPMLDELATTLEEVHGLVAAATQGEGTIAQLLNNPDLYESMNDAAIRLEQALREVQLLAEKLKAEGITIW